MTLRKQIIINLIKSNLSHKLEKILQVIVKEVKVTYANCHLTQQPMQPLRNLLMESALVRIIN